MVDYWHSPRFPYLFTYFPVNYSQFRLHTRGWKPNSGTIIIHPGDGNWFFSSWSIKERGLITNLQETQGQQVQFDSFSFISWKLCWFQSTWHLIEQQRLPPNLCTKIMNGHNLHVWEADKKISRIKQDSWALGTSFTSNLPNMFSCSEISRQIIRYLKMQVYCVSYTQCTIIQHNKVETGKFWGPKDALQVKSGLLYTRTIMQFLFFLRRR